MLAFIDGSVVNVGLPQIAADLKASGAVLSWVVNAYALPLSALILMGGGLGDRYGRRLVFLVGLAMFTVASLLCAVAPSFWVMLLGRAVQGVGAALLMPNSLALLGGAFEGEQRGRAIGTWASAGALAGVLGPVFGGWLIDSVGWRAIFLINLPVALGAAYCAWRYVEEQVDSQRADRLDWLGSLAATVTLGLLTWSFTEAANPTRHLNWVIGAALGGVLAACAFLACEYKLKERALMPFSIFSSRAFVGLNLMTWFLYGSLGGLIVLLPFLLIEIEHWSALAAGAALLPIPIVIGLGSRLMGRYAERIGARWPLTVGSGFVALGLVLLARIGVEPASYWVQVFPPTLLVAIGVGLCVAPLTTAVIASVDKSKVGLASGINNAVARIAGLVATALLGFVFSAESSAQAFIPPYRVAALIGAASAVLSGLCALMMLRTTPRSGSHG
jgi:EmrB/QacA subfamily drug resistance transporter